MEALGVNFFDTSPASLFLSLGFWLTPPAVQFAGSLNNTILRNIAVNRVLVRGPNPLGRA
jgi:hypothetical protein